MLNFNLFGGCNNSNFLFSGISKTNSTHTFSLETSVYRVFTNTTNFLDSSEGEFSLFFPTSDLIPGKFIVLVDIGLNLEKNNVKILMEPNSKIFGEIYNNNMILNQNSSIYFFFYSGPEIGWVYSIYYLDTDLNPLKFNHTFYANSNYLQTTRFLYQADLLLDAALKQANTRIDLLNSVDIINIIKQFDGHGSGLDADLLDGQHGAYYLDWINFINKPNTVAGYNITDTFTKTEVNNNITTAINNLIANAPTTLDTLQEIAIALNNDPNFYNTLNALVNLKLNISDYNPLDILNKLKTLDGSGSGLDADLLDGRDSNYFQTALGYTPVQQGGGIGQLTNSVYIGWSGTNLKGQVDGADLGNFLFLDSSGNLPAYINANSILSKLLTVDGSGSGLDADLLDGRDSSYYLNYNNLVNTPGSFVSYVNTTFALGDSISNLELRSFDDTGSVTLAFHRPGAYASKFGINTLGQFEWGGWSANPALMTLDPNGALTCKGQIQTPYLFITGGTSSTIALQDTDQGNRFVHNNDSTIGFLNTTSAWVLRVGDDGNIWTPMFGWFSSAFAAKQDALGFYPVQQGGGIGHAGNKIYIGWTNSYLKAQVDSTDVGAFVFKNTDGNVSLEGAIGLGSYTPMTITNPGFVYFQHQTDHIAYIKKSGANNFYWRRNDTGLVGGPNEFEMMSLNDNGDCHINGTTTVNNLIVNGTLTTNGGGSSAVIKSNQTVSTPGSSSGAEYGNPWSNSGYIGFKRMSGVDTLNLPTHLVQINPVDISKILVSVLSSYNVTHDLYLQTSTYGHIHIESFQNNIPVYEYAGFVPVEYKNLPSPIYVAYSLFAPFFFQVIEFN